MIRAAASRPFISGITIEHGRATDGGGILNDGGKLTGTTEGARGGAIPIEEGTVSGNTIKFEQKTMGRGGEVINVYTGTISGDEIKFSRMAEGGTGMPVEFTAKRAS